MGVDSSLVPKKGSGEALRKRRLRGGGLSESKRENKEGSDHQGDGGAPQE